MQVDYISNLPEDISNIIFINNLDDVTKTACLSLNKKINEFIATKWMQNQGFTAPSYVSSELMNFYKEYCQFILKKMPGIKNLASISSCKTVIEAKNALDHALISNVRSDCNYIEEILYRFLHEIEPTICSNNPIDNRYNNSLIFDPNKEVQLLLRAGAKPCDFHFSRIVQKSWCTAETLSLFLDKSKENRLTLIYALRQKKFREILPIILKKIEFDNSSIVDFCGNLPSSFECLLDPYIDGVKKVHENGLLMAIISKYTDNFILKLLKKCRDNIDDETINYALKEKLSDSIVSELLDKCSRITNITIQSALDNSYSQKIIEKLLSKFSPENEEEKLNTLIIKDCRYDESLIELWLYKYFFGKIFFKANFFV